MNGAETSSATRLLSEVRTEIGRADSKAAVLVGAITMLVGLLGGLLVGQGWTPARLSPLAALLWWGGIGALAVSLLALLLTVVPQHRRSAWEPGMPLGYFEDIRRAADSGSLASALTEADRDPFPPLVAALAGTSRIAARKHRSIRVALVAFGTASALLPSALLIG
ncbi:Pycsar system effector family protein [Streptomyces sp. NPDC050504]|uniref:Pycsar system effector family protein n=1 Tax=Streptomyces sp. NPDC050504 TaxID=3365618 RepID=UPI0037929377